MRVRAALVVVWLGGCGRFGFDPHERADAIVDVLEDAALDDAMIDAPPPMGPFGTPMMLSGLGGAGTNDDPSMTADQLEIFFESDRAGGAGLGDLYAATRATPTSAWTAPINITSLNGTGDDVTPSISPDGLTLYFAQNGPSGQKDIFVTTRATRQTAWAAPTAITEVSSSGDDVGPALTTDTLTMVISTDRAGTDDLWISMRASTSATWSAPARMTELDTASVESEPWINGSKTFIVFHSDRAGGAGGTDLYFARRTSPAVPFDPPQRMTELNTAGDDGDPWLSADERTIVFARGNNLFVATR